MIKRLEKKTGKPFEREVRKPGMDIISLKSPWSRAKLNTQLYCLQGSLERGKL
jgi:hypothetical protein